MSRSTEDLISIDAYAPFHSSAAPRTTPDRYMAYNARSALLMQGNGHLEWAKQGTLQVYGRGLPTRILLYYFTV